MSNKTEWPQSLKDFANRTFAACTDANRAAVSEELKALIFKSFQEGTIHTTDWEKVELSSLKKKKVPIKKRPASAVAGSSGASNGVAAGGLSWEEQSRREKRARRFENDERARKLEEEQQLQYQPMMAASTSSGYGLAARMGGAGASNGFGAPVPTGGNAAGSHSYVLDPGYQQVASGPPPIGKAGGIVPLGGGSAFGVGKGAKGKMRAAGPIVPLGSNGQAGAFIGAAPVKRGGGYAPVAAAGFGFSDADVADPNVIDWDEHTVVGTSTKLEKPYLRLTSAPDPKTVRPLPVLEQTLELLKKKWRAEQNYAYICDQFKSMRQDLTVQRIKNPFTVKVYEIHARIALEKGDLGEYNQCQSQLRMLYAYKLPGCVMEFLAYRILYLLHTRNRREVNTLMTELEEKHKQDPAVKHALQVRNTIITGNYHRFFKLYEDAPNMNAYIMDHFVERERVRALTIMAKGFRPNCPLSFITSELSFTDDEECVKFLSSISADVFVDPTPAQAAAAIAEQQQQQQQKSKQQNSSGGKSGIPLSERKWDAKAALPAVLAASVKYRKVDIKGQI